MSIRFPSARQLWLGSYWTLCGLGLLWVLWEGRVDNFFNASSDYWAGWVLLVLLSMPWFLLFGYVLAFLQSAGDASYAGAVVLSIAINSYLIYRGTRGDARHAV
jgi:hypothetical protein